MEIEYIYYILITQTLAMLAYSYRLVHLLLSTYSQLQLSQITMLIAPAVPHSALCINERWVCTKYFSLYKALFLCSKSTIGIFF